MIDLYLCGKLAVAKQSFSSDHVWEIWVKEKICYMDESCQIEFV